MFGKIPAVLIIRQTLKAGCQYLKLFGRGFLFRLVHPALIVGFPEGKATSILRFCLGICLGNVSGIGRFQFCNCPGIGLLGLLHPVIQLGEEVLLLIQDGFRHSSHSKLLRTGQPAVILPPAFLLPVLLLPTRDLGSVAQIKTIQFPDGSFFHIAGQGIFFRHFADMGILCFDVQGLGANTLVHILALAHQGIQSAALLLGQSLAEISLGIAGVVVQHVFKEALRLDPVAVLQSHVAPVQQGSDLVASSRIAHDHLLLHHGYSRLRFGQQLFNAPEQIGNGAHLAHVLTLQMGKFLGHIVCIQSLVAGDQILVLVLGDDL